VLAITQKSNPANGSGTATVPLFCARMTP
jgi:hypothetical protein